MTATACVWGTVTRDPGSNQLEGAQDAEQEGESAAGRRGAMPRRKKNLDGPPLLEVATEEVDL